LSYNLTNSSAEIGEAESTHAGSDQLFGRNPRFITQSFRDCSLLDLVSVCGLGIVVWATLCDTSLNSVRRDLGIISSNVAS